MLRGTRLLAARLPRAPHAPSAAGLPRARGLSDAPVAAAPSGVMSSLCREWTPSSVRVGAIGMKCGMTQGWDKDGKVVALTVVELQDVQVAQVREEMTSGFWAMQLGAGWQKRKRLANDEARRFEAHGLPLKRYLREFRVTADAMLPLGTSIGARHFVPGQRIDVQGVTKGKGFAGAMKRWGFKGQPASHGVSLTHRHPGSMGGAAGSMYGTRIKPGKKMPGKMGNKRRTVQAMEVWKIVPQHNLLYLRGSVPGGRGKMLRLRDTNHPRKQFAEVPPFPTFLPGDPGDGDDDVLLAPRAT